jgi:hypothetical protein
MTPDQSLLLEMQALALAAYPTGAPPTFALDLHRIVFAGAYRPVRLGDLMVSAVTAGRIRSLAVQSKTWWLTGSGFPERRALLRVV